MKIKKIELKNGYKRFFDLTIDLGENPKRIIVLVGPNGCGKSSVLDGMLFVANAYGRIGNQDAKNYEYHSMNKTPGYGHDNVVISFDHGTFAEISSERARQNREKTIFSLRSPYRYNSNLKILESKRVVEIKENSYGASNSSNLDEKMEDNYRRLYIEYTKYLNLNDCRPSEAKEKIIGDLNGSISNCLNLKISSIGDIDSSKGTLYFIKNDHSSEFEFNVLSSGEKEVVDILLDLYLRREEYNETIFLIDEPELHISTSIQKNLIIEINRLVGENCQIWITTHSIGFLRGIQQNLKDQCQIIRFKDEYNLASNPYTLTPEKNTSANWKEIFKVALDDLVHLVSPKRIIYCEGRDQPGINGQERGLDAKVFNNIFSEKYHDTQFISSGGNTELDQRSDIAIAILTKVFQNIEILVLKDRDIASGKTVSETERQLHLQNSPNNHRVLKRWEIENYLYDKEVLKAYCIKMGLNFNEPAYNEFVKDIENDNLKDETGRIKNFCGINTNINAEKFKLNLSEVISEDMSIFQELENCIFSKN